MTMREEQVKTEAEQLATQVASLVRRVRLTKEEVERCQAQVNHAQLCLEEAKAQHGRAVDELSKNVAKVLVP